MPSGFTSTPDGEWFVWFGSGAVVELVNETWDDVGFFKVEVIVGTEHVGWDDGSKVATVLLVVTFVHDIDHTFSV